ncbi:hypothetical protein L9W84_17355 [Vibrio aestuarianus]|nr:hypothetical protein [Vibrio aestuarianus]MDE1215358.1 hypothetical protein [Vibrio aestuarianus]MDE1262460.1 hypothetical protein [Vibrio aestuarianus]MDE1276746.1 hypothetical protein [Vibrio aestuarianus]MDE1283866.1 hypothetical protein [Vibrio aestuarianus]MDE1291226.1 hypothetical protein [Vibrio aestuarianus]
MSGIPIAVFAIPITDFGVRLKVIGETYFLWGVAGHGVVPAIHELSQYVRNAGLKTISAHTYFAGLARLVRKLNTTEQAATNITELTMRV